MKKFICKSLLFCFTMLILLGGITAFVLFGLPQQFGMNTNKYVLSSNETY